MFHRKVYNDLKKWKEESNGASAVLIEGARRVGVTRRSVIPTYRKFSAY